METAENMHTALRIVTLFVYMITFILVLIVLDRWKTKGFRGAAIALVIAIAASAILTIVSLQSTAGYEAYLALRLDLSYINKEGI